LHYFDYNATTPIAPEVLDAMIPFLRDHWGNPSSVYSFGHGTGDAIKQARQSIAALIGAKPDEIVFTSCGTESSNTALRTGVRAAPDRRHVIMSSVEHPANLSYGEVLEAEGHRVTYLPVGADGLFDMGELEAAIEPDTAMVSMMWANNETGVIFPISEIGALCRKRGVLFHTDAVQAAGKVPIDVDIGNVDYLSLTGHKIYAPKGVGVLYVRKGAPFTPVIIGGGQEKDRRGGTLNVASIVAMGEAARLVSDGLEAESSRLRGLRDRLEGEIMKGFGTVRNGSVVSRLPNTANLAFDGLESEALLLLLDEKGICASSGSACSTGSLDPSHVLSAMGVTRSNALGSVRLSLGRMTRTEDVDYLLETLPGMIQRLRGVSPR
jgi:cysteine desulfurase